MDWPSRRQLTPLAIAFEGALTLLAVGLGWLLGRPVWSQIAWQPSQALIGVLATLPMLAALWLCLRSSWPPLVRLQRICDQLVIPMFANCRVIDLAAISALAGLGEEALFRGVLQGTLAVWLSPALALLLSGIAFGLVHLITIEYGVLATLFGLYLGLLWQMSENLLAPVFTHGLYDFIALIVLTRFKAVRSGDRPNFEVDSLTAAARSLDAPTDPGAPLDPSITPNTP